MNTQATAAIPGAQMRTGSRLAALIPKRLQALFEQREVEALKVYPGLNTAKGLLILLVLFAHALPAGMIQFFNYFFEMPLFMAISGFLMKKKVFKGGLRKYTLYIVKRLFVPWLVASLVYLPLSLEGRSLMQLSVADIMYPFYHLWFIPGYGLGALLCCAIVRFRLSALPIIIVAGMFTIVWYLIFRDSPVPLTEQPLYWLGDKRFYAYQFFFILGFSMRNKLLSLKTNPLALFSLLVPSFILIAMFVETGASDKAVVLPYMLFNFALAVYILYFYSPQTFLRSRFVDYVNKNSLGIYLFHPFIMMCIYRFIGDPHKQYVSDWVGFVVGMITLAIVLALVWMLQKFSFTSKYVLGNIKPKQRTVNNEE